MPQPAPSTRIAPSLRVWGSVLLALVLVMPVRGQDPPKVSRHSLPAFYHEARFQMVLQRVIRETGLYLAPLPAEHLASEADTLHHWLATRDPNYVPVKEEPDPTVIQSWQLVKRIERAAYVKQFDEVKWAYLGNNYFTPLDTVLTREIRARMQARFGAPTKTLVELDYSRRLRMEEYIQFEYWFILNDSIPMIVMDVNGPFERGIVVACDQRYRSVLFQLRQSFLGTLMQEEYGPYVDYYYHYRNRQWYRTGYDGRRFFRHAIGQPNLARGRPKLAPQGE
ncbi:MAG: hypothetical protein ACE5G0_04335 [Rhodothermales bacterium]